MIKRLLVSSQLVTMLDIHTRTVRWATIQMAGLTSALPIDTRGTGILPYYWKNTTLVTQDANLLLKKSSQLDFIKWYTYEALLSDTFQDNLYTNQILNITGSMESMGLRRSRRLANKSVINYKC